jgi:hypothetical protein
MQYWIRCSISLGQFGDEYGVDGHEHDDTPFSLFAPRDTVKFEVAPTRENSVPGVVLVEVIERKGNLVLVRLPRSTFQAGYFVTVKSDQLEAQSPPQKAARTGKKAKPAVGRNPPGQGGRSSGLRVGTRSVAAVRRSHSRR